MTGPPSDDTGLVPWRPAGVPESLVEGDTDNWRYIVLEEIVDGTALLRRWRWPMADQLGHLVWTEEAPLDSATIPVDELRDSLYRPNELEREPRIGDTYATVSAHSPPPWKGHQVRSLRKQLGGEIYDVSGEARQASWLAYQGSLSPVQAAETVAEDEAVVESETETLSVVLPVAPARSLRVAPDPGRASRGRRR